MSTTAAEKLVGLALRIVLSDHVGIPAQDIPDLLTEAEAVFAPKKPRAVKSKKAALRKTTKKAA
ncbi:hypothetical protein [Terriglobus roseus]|nr:hypothetical protein [Terriglobus roseus]